MRSWRAVLITPKSLLLIAKGSLETDSNNSMSIAVSFLNVLWPNMVVNDLWR